MANFNLGRRRTIATILGAPLALGSAAIKSSAQTVAPGDPGNDARMRGRLSVLDFIPPNLHRAIRAGRARDDLTACFHAAAVAANADIVDEAGSGGSVFVPNGTYYIDRVGIRDTIFQGENQHGTILRPVGPGQPDEFMLDAMLDRDGRTRNTAGGGWVTNLTIDAARSGRSCLRTYGGGVRATRLTLIGGAVGLSAGLPIWAVFENIHARDCSTGFETFAVEPGDSGTSTSFRNCWAQNAKKYGFRISQLGYSSFINCAGQDSGEANFFVEGDRNGSPAVYSLQFIGCGSEGYGTPFRFRRCRDLSVIGPRVIGPDNKHDYLVMDDSAGSIRDYSTPAPLPTGRHHIAVINHGSGAGSILLEDCTVSFEPNVASAFTIIGGAANGIPGIQASRMRWMDAGRSADAAIDQRNGAPFLTLSTNGRAMVAFGLDGGTILNGARVDDPGRLLQPGDYMIEVLDGGGAVLHLKDRSGAVRRISLG
ncbi:MAG: hypothetical protein C0474_00060 [Sphingobium sp.]|nr:hypothetical protein [Sphingobium sp.]